MAVCTRQPLSGVSALDAVAVEHSIIKGALLSSIFIRKWQRKPRLVFWMTGEQRPTLLRSGRILH